jgi:acetolactate synthase-1/2/3 large subunit
VKYSDQFVDWLVEEGYTHCFFVAGGNIMHLLDSVRTRMVCVPYVHEVAATIAAEYFTATRDPGAGKAFVMVTAGPGLTNALTGIASAWGESRELLVVGGQVKRSDLSRGEVRQRGIQELDGAALAEPICKRVVRVEVPARREEIVSAVRDGAGGRPGPVFIEMCLDAQAAAPVADDPAPAPIDAQVERIGAAEVDRVAGLLAECERPVLLLGAGVSRQGARELESRLVDLGVPVMLTWNGADRLPEESPVYAGRPNTWGQRSANVLLQQSDLLIAVGTRLGLQQSGFAWDEFAPLATVVQVDIDQAELDKGHPHVEVRLRGDATAFLADLLDRVVPHGTWAEWRAHVERVRELLPLNESANETAPGFVKPYELMMALGDVAGPDDVIIPCSSGGAFTVTMQSLRLRGDQKILTNKAVASMGYGLSGAIGASLANPGRRTFLIEGDGGFSQNLQELGTVAVNRLPLKILLFANNGYASIRMTQRNYFQGAWIGCDEATGLGMPDWELLARSYGIPYARMDGAAGFDDPRVAELLAAEGPAVIEVPIDPEQTYYPKIMSAVQPDGSMKSNPLHLMHPELEPDVAAIALKYLTKVEAK